MTLSPRGERTTPTLLQPRQPVLRESQNGDNEEKEDDDDAGSDELHYMQVNKSLVVDGHHCPSKISYLYKSVSHKIGNAHMYICIPDNALLP